MIVTYPSLQFCVIDRGQINTCIIFYMRMDLTNLFIILCHHSLTYIFDVIHHLDNLISVRPLCPS